jgi:glycosyltransferase involved in cell wall biosynthesis
VVRNRRIVGFWVWELPVPSSDWRAGTRFVHDAWMPTAFAADALAPLLPRRPLVVPFPMAIAPPEPAPLHRADFGLPQAPVVVLVSFNLASSFERKNPLGAIAAFRAAFGDRTDRLLLLKIGNPQHYPADFARLSDAVAGAPNIRLETRTLPAPDALALTVAADIVLSLHRSEGFGLVPAEAMLLGRPVVATGWSGNMQFMDADSAALVRYRLVAPADPRKVYAVPGALWAEPDLGHAVELLRHLADDAPARLALGAAGRTHALTSLGATALADAVRGLSKTVPAMQATEVSMKVST